MPRAELDVHPEALQEAQSAYLWYSLQSEGAGDSFMAELERALDQVADHLGT